MFELIRVCILLVLFNAVYGFVYQEGLPKAFERALWQIVAAIIMFMALR